MYRSPLCHLLLRIEAKVSKPPLPQSSTFSLTHSNFHFPSLYPYDNSPPPPHPTPSLIHMIRSPPQPRFPTFILQQCVWITSPLCTALGFLQTRLVQADALKVRQADVTRETVQKSVCVLSRVVGHMTVMAPLPPTNSPPHQRHYQCVPLYGLLQAKLQLITHAYFEEKDFSQISILKELYEHMNGSLRGTALEGSQVYLGLSPRDLILHFRHKSTLLPPAGMIEHGLADSSHYRPKSSVSEEVTLEPGIPGSEEFVSVSVTDIANATQELVGGATEEGEGLGQGGSPPLMRVEDSPPQPPSTGDNNHLKPPSRTSPESSESDWETLDPSVLEEGGASEQRDPPQLPETFDPEPSLPITVQPQSVSGQASLTPGLVSGLEEDQYGLPLAIFTKGYLCLPYMALQQHHLLSDVTVRGFVAGATNILFRQQRHLSDAVVEVSPVPAHLCYLCCGLLHDYLLKHVTENREDVFLDGTGWEGGDEWIRAQFGLYVHSLLSSSLQQDNEKLLADYGVPFISAWKNTHNYRVWHSNKHPAMAEITPG
ncbi:hypothetical protein JZ751_015881 [Albula glossodonta]|uniref:AVL9/DENND6 domain-containing protein n=1 Tax=Albula glossodonta TaxID=121402 RepID=A0A8T2MVF8_9TELE|nr:hypothetical protein JZ751_015881 [Albula glossodonta]